ncbi:MAG: hypothetical protein K0R08_436 [Solimicrobium sp.]|nr:hypothetical protein [Solimicrobium sp.]
MPHNHGLRCRDGGIGRRTGLKIPRWKQRAGSIPAPGTTKFLSSIPQLQNPRYL